VLLIFTARNLPTVNNERRKRAIFGRDDKSGEKMKWVLRAIS